MTSNRMTMPFPEATMNEIVRPAIVEFIGTLALIFMGAGSIIVTGGNDLVAIAFAHGLAIGLLVAAVGLHRHGAALFEREAPGRQPLTSR